MKRTRQAQYIFWVRLNNGLKQNQMAKILKVSAQFLGRIEKGTVPIPTVVLKRLLKKTNCSSENFVHLATMDFKEDLLEKLR